MLYGINIKNSINKIHQIWIIHPIWDMELSQGEEKCMHKTKEQKIGRVLRGG